MSKVFKYYLFFIFLIFGLVSPFYIEFASAYHDDDFGVWKMDETGGATAYDSTDNSNDLTIYSSAWIQWTSDAVFDNACWYFDNYQLAKSTDIDTSEFTFGCWIQDDEVDDSTEVFLSLGGSTMFYIYTGSKTACIRIGGSDPICDTLSTTGTTFYGNGYHHVVWVMDESTQYLYIDGVEILSGDTGSALPITISNVEFGGGNVYDNVNHGYYDDAFLTLRALSSDEVSYIYESGKPYDGEMPDPVDFSFSTSTTDVLLGEWYSVSYNATSTSGALQNCGLWIPFWQEWIFADDVSGQTCELEVLIENAHIGENVFVGSAVVDWTAYYSDDFIVTGHIDEDLDEYDPSDLPTITFTAENSTTTIGVENTWTIESDDDIMVTKVQVWNPELSSWVVFGSGNSSSSLDVDYDWTPFMAGSYYFTARVYDNHGQIGEPDPLFVQVVVYEDVEGGITVPPIPDVIAPDQHFIISSAQALVSWLKLPELWNWFTSLFKAKFPFSWFFGIFDIWDSQRATISGLDEVEAIKTSWTFPESDTAFSGKTFVLFDLQEARIKYSGFFDTIRIILINIFWLGFASVVFFKVKKFIGDMSIHD